MKEFWLSLGWQTSIVGTSKFFWVSNGVTTIGHWLLIEYHSTLCEDLLTPIKHWHFGLENMYSKKMHLKNVFTGSSSQAQVTLDQRPFVNLKISALKNGFTGFQLLETLRVRDFRTAWIKSALTTSNETLVVAEEIGPLQEAEQLQFGIVFRNAGHYNWRRKDCDQFGILGEHQNLKN